MKHIIAVSGTPGTGKTTLSRLLCERTGWQYVSGQDIIDRFSLAEEYDQQRECVVVDVDAFVKATLEVVKSHKGIVVVDSHLSHELDVSCVLRVLITTCSQKNLIDRLSAREYSAHKIRENLDAELFKVCLVEARDKGHDVIEVDTSFGVSDQKLTGLVRRLHLLKNNKKDT